MTLAFVIEPTGSPTIVLTTGRSTVTPRTRRSLARRCGADGARACSPAGAFLLLAGGVALGAWRHYSQQQQVMATAEQERDFVPSVRVATVKANAAVMSVTLPATTAAFAQAEIYARATGYIGKRNVDIGDHVKQGEVLAELAVPEQDDHDFPKRSDAQSAPSGAGSGAGQLEARTSDLGPGPAAGRVKAGRPSSRAQSTSRP